MRRRNTDSSPTGNLDSLLDTMTNVVGILIIVIIVSQINVASAVKRIRAGMEPVSVEQMAKLQSERERVAQQIESVRSATDKVDPAAMAALQKEVAALEKQLEEVELMDEKNEALVDLFAEKQKTLEELKAAVKREEQGVIGLDQKIARMELQKTPAKRVRLPNPRDPYEDAREVLFFCAGDRIMLVDYPGLLARTVKEIQGKKSLVAEMKGKTPYYHQEQSKKHIGSRRIRSAGVAVSIVTFPDRPWGQLVMTPDFKRGGQTIKEGLAHGSELRQQINRAKSDRNYIRFLVHPDAFETYLLARRLAEEIFIPVGWEPTGAKELRRSLPGIRFAHVPPPPADPKKKPPAKPAKPKKKPNVLD